MDAWVSEPFFYYAKFTPFLEEYKEAVGVPFMRHTAMVIEKVPGGEGQVRGGTGADAAEDVRVLLRGSLLRGSDA
jgi:hypothetical protein